MRNTILTVLVSIFTWNDGYADEIACIPRSEMGETVTGQNLYERDADLKLDNLSRIDFEALTIKSAEGKSSSIVVVGENVYRTADPDAKYQFYFISNTTRTIVTELSVSETATYIKVLLCK